jgi:aryl-alcohol dehydrogenase-like predicted oxidoreductase
LKTDHVDLMQFHEVIRFDDVDRFFAEGGAAEALTEARQSGKTRYVGFTGHKDPHIHLYMLEMADRHGFTFDTVQMPLNLLDFHYRSFEQVVLPELVARRIGVLGMKSLAGGVLLKAGIATAEQCLRYALRLPVSTVITGIDSDEILDQALRVAKASIKPMSDDELEVLREPSRKHAIEGKFELFKTSAYFDSTAKHPDYLGEDTAQVVELGA